ncbi:hypothetical protein D1BOALGB6SA_3293 [Olavius sp. associated proteobacterium Delta 1]|nr:hypothetical protein D1BOALGB6SA_3293 [Olavius sp. associated proteobacterium Delta 1]
MIIRKLTDKGIERFRDYLVELRQDSKTPPPFILLENSEFSAPIEGDPEVEPQTFSTRLELAQYLNQVLDGIFNDSLQDDVQLWSWLSLYFFDQVCPVEENGLRKPGRDYRHILEPGYPNGHRHLLAGTYLVYSVYGLDENLSRLLLWTPLHLESKFHNQLAARQTLITNRGILDAADKMYFNESESKPKRGALMEKSSPGTLLRFIDVIQQLDLTYDLYSLSGEEILALLPPEFDKWQDSQP